MKPFKRFVSATLIICALLIALPLTASAYGTYTSDDGTVFTYTTNEDGGTVTITGCAGTGTALTVPGTIEGLTVTGLGDGAFGGLKFATVDIPDSVTAIGSGCFKGCAALQSVTIPDRVKELGSSCFEDCVMLTSVVCGLDLLSIGDNCFRNCTKLQSVELNDGLTRIGAYAFQKCKQLSSISLPDSVEELGEYALSGCSKLNAVTLSSSLTRIEDHLLDSCLVITSVVIPEGVTYIGDYVFNNNTSTLVITVPASVTYIGVQQFSYPNRITVKLCAGSYAETFFTTVNTETITGTRPVTGMALADGAESVTVPYGQELKPNLAISPEAHDGYVSFASDNESVVSVTESGKLYGAGTGSANITATASSGATFTFTATVKTLTGVEVTAMPDSAEYGYGDKPDYTGMVLTARYADGTSSEVSGYTVSGYSRASLGEQTVTVSYCGEEATFSVETSKHTLGSVTDGLSYDYKAGKNDILTFDGEIPSGCAVYVAEYLDDALTLRVSAVSAIDGEIRMSGDFAFARIFVLDAAFAPICGTVTLYRASLHDPN